MRGTVFLFLTLLTLILVSMPVSAAQFSGNYLLYVCSSDKNGEELTPGGHIACQAYIAGVLDYNTLIRSLGTAPSVDFCVPEGTDMNTLQKHVLRYVYKHRSQHGNFIAAPAVALGLYDKYPCK